MNDHSCNVVAADKLATTLENITEKYLISDVRTPLYMLLEVLEADSMYNSLCDAADEHAKRLHHHNKCKHCVFRASPSKHCSDGVGNDGVFDGKTPAKEIAESCRARARYIRGLINIVINGEPNMHKVIDSNPNIAEDDASDVKSKQTNIAESSTQSKETPVSINSKILLTWDQYKDTMRQKTSCYVHNVNYDINGDKLMSIEQFMNESCKLIVELQKAVEDAKSATTTTTTKEIDVKTTDEHVCEMPFTNNEFLLTSKLPLHILARIKADDNRMSIGTYMSMHNYYIKELKHEINSMRPRLHVYKKACSGYRDVIKALELELDEQQSLIDSHCD